MGNQINSVIDGLQNKAKKPAGLKKRNTMDKRSCISACSADPTPGKPGATSPPKDADPYANDDSKNIPLKPESADEIKKKKDISPFNFSEAYVAKFGTYDPSQVKTTESIGATCVTTL